MVLKACEQTNTIETILDTRKVTPKQVLTLRREVWPDNRISRSEAELLFEINDSLEESCGEWRDFFAEAMVAHLVGQGDPLGYVGDEAAAWFQTRILADGTVKGETELEALLQVVERAYDAPERLQRFVLEAVRVAVVTGDGAVVGDAKLRRGSIGDPEVAILRRALYAKAGNRSAAISREEAELLFDLNDMTVDGENCAAWSALFVNAIANYLLAASGYEPPARERLKELDRWMNAPGDGVRGFFVKMLKRSPDVSGFARELSGQVKGESPIQRYYARRLAEDDDATLVAEQVDAGEAQWLTRRIGADGRVSRNEAALLAMLKSSGLDIDDALAPLLKRVA